MLDQFFPDHHDNNQDLFVSSQIPGYPTPEDTPADQVALDPSAAPIMTPQETIPQHQQDVVAAMPPRMTRQQALMANRSTDMPNELEQSPDEVQSQSPETGPTSWEVGKLANGEDWQADLYPVVGREGVTPFCKKEFAFETAWGAITRPDPDTNTVFTTYEEAAEWRSEQCTHDAAPEDDTVPETQDQKRALVKLLFKAFKSTHYAKDNEPIKEPFLKERHDNRRVEAMCWDLLYAVIKRSETGPLLQAYDPCKVTNSGTMGSFADRFDAVVQALYTFKTICKHLFDAPYINVLVDDPNRAKSRVMSNKRLNALKGDTMKLGKKARAAMAPDAIQNSKRRRRNVPNTTPSSYDDDIDRSSLTSIDSPVKRFRTPTRKTRRQNYPRHVTGGTTPNNSPASMSNTSPYVLSPDVKAESGITTLANTFNPPTPGAVHLGHYHAMGTSAGPDMVMLPANAHYYNQARHAASNPLHHYMMNAPNTFTGYTMPNNNAPNAFTGYTMPRNVSQASGETYADARSFMSGHGVSIISILV